MSIWDDMDQELKDLPGPIGGYTIISRLGKGGNGIVYKVTKGGNEFALKTLLRPNQNSFKRFRDEISVLLRESSNPGILPILDHHLGTSISDCWYVMPVATPIAKHLGKKKPEVAIRLMMQVAATLQDLHTKRVFHRDIKPNNIYFYEDRCVLSDFGLVAFPKKEPMTPRNKKLGPFATIAPEMRRDPNSAEASLADVYSLSKTLWILLTGEELGFDGAYDSDDQTISIERNKTIQFYTYLHHLFERSTVNDPSARIGIAEMIDILQKHLKADFNDYCNIEWKEITKRLFNSTEPATATWESPAEISSVLSLIAKYQWINHLYFPNGGGHDVKGDAQVADGDFVRLTLGSTTYTFKPDMLVFCSVNKNPLYNFFWIECQKVDPLFPDYARSHIEDLLEYVDGTGIHLESEVAIDEDEFDRLRQEKKARRLCRIYDGKLLIMSKSSVWNLLPDSYAAGHMKYSWNVFRRELLKLEARLPSAKPSLLPHIFGHRDS